MKRKTSNREAQVDVDLRAHSGTELLMRRVKAFRDASTTRKLAAIEAFYAALNGD